ncbi:MAG: bifunctional nuclease family protein [Muribaculaceae bacterium]|nr:bifunctional nuclease family protein [Muribaculaceae bacterium]
MEKHKLELVGITYNQIESGVYAVILREVGGERRIPIIIGYPEAQAIECKLQDVVTPRPLTHDMMINFMTAYGISLKEIEIKRLPNGVFAADLIFTDGENTRVVDARSSDGIALAIRAGAPIYTSEEVLSEAGFLPEETRRKPRQGRRVEPQGGEKINTPRKNDNLSECTLEDLNNEMQKAAENEDYEKAAKIKAEIDRRKAEADSE